MTLQEITSEVNRQTQGNYDNATFMDWINACLSDLADVVYLPTTLTIAAELDDSFILPANFKGDLKILASGDTTFLQPVSYDELVNVGYAMYNNVVYIRNRQGVTSITAMYDRMPAKMLPVPSSSPDVPPMYHSAVVEYCKAQAMLYEEDIASDERYHLYWNEYRRLREQANQYFSKARSTTQQVSEWRVVR